MPKLLVSALDLTRRSYFLAKPFGRKKLAFVFAFSLTQGIFQIVGVSSIFPFLALAADPSQLRDSGTGKWILERLPAMDDSQLLMVTGVLALFMLLLSNVVSLASEVNRAHYVRSLGHWLRVGLINNIASRSYGDFLQQNSSILLKKVTTDVIQYTSGVLLPLLDSMARLNTIILLLATLLLINPSVAIGAALLFGIFYFGVFRYLGAQRQKVTDGLKKAERGIMLEAQQLLGGIKPIKVHRAEEPFLQRFRQHSGSQAKLQASLPLYQNGPRYLIEPLAFGGVVVVVIIYAARGESFNSLLPTLGVMALAGYRLLPALQFLYSQLTVITTTRHALDEIYEEFVAVERGMDKEITNTRSRFTAPPAMTWEKEIKLKNLTFQYPGVPRPVIDNLNLTIAKNSSLGIIGTTGSGKSTLVDIVLGLHQPTKGAVYIDGVPLTPENRRAWRGGIGYVPQDIFLIDDTIAANIAFGIATDEIDPQRLREAATAAQILEFIEGLPDQWESRVGERGVRLSGGQRQRVGLARALYHKPSLLILDEATSALDIETETEVMKAIDGLHGKITMLVIAHRLSTIEKCQYRLDLGANQAKATVASDSRMEHDVAQLP